METVVVRRDHMGMVVVRAGDMVMDTDRAGGEGGTDSTGALGPPPLTEEIGGKSVKNMFGYMLLEAMVIVKQS